MRKIFLSSLIITTVALVLLLGCAKKKEEAQVQPAPQPAAQQQPVTPAAPVAAPAPEVTQRTQPAREPARTVTRRSESQASTRGSRIADNSVPATPVTPVEPVAPVSRQPLPEAEPMPQVAPRPQAPPRPQTAVVPAGTPLDVRLTQALSSAKENPGDTFEAELEQDLEVDGKVLAARGSRIIGKISDVEGSGRVKGRARMSLTLTEIQTGPNSYPIRTNSVSFEAESSKTKDAVKVGGAAGIGAVIGAIAGGKKGAAIGAVIGGGAGAGTVLATKGKEVELDSEQRLNFTLERQVQMKIQSFQNDDNRAQDVEPARSGNTAGIEKRVEGKLKKVHAAMPGWVSRGGDASRVQPLMEEVQRHLQAGNPVAAEEKLDQVLAIIQKSP